MAPTICSEKKQLRETRRHHGVATAAISSSSSSAAATASSSSSSSTGSTSAAAATQTSSVLNYVAKGSMNSSRRRPVRLQRRMPHILARVASFSTDTSSGVETEVEMDSDQIRSDHQIQMLQQQQQPHSSSSSSSDNNIKTVLQPTMASGYSSKHNRSAGQAKNCDQDAVPMQVVVDDDDDGDSGYEYSQDPIKEQHLYHQNSEGLLSIAIKTIKLVQRNKLLQKRLAQLQLETSEFIASVLSNPENRQFREKISPKAEAKVSNMLLRH